MTGNLLVLDLYHGRLDPEQNMKDWGMAGPVLGPLTAVFVTYGSDIRIHFASVADAKQFFPEAEAVEQWLEIGREGLIKFRGVYYGDFSIHGWAEQAGTA